MHHQTKPELSINRAHGVADKVEKVIDENFEHIESTFIHVEPERKSNQLVVIPVADSNGIASIVHEHFARAPYFLLAHLHTEDVDVVAVHENVHVNSGEHLGIKTSRLINEYGADILLVASIGEVSYHMVDSNMVDIYRVKSGLPVQQALADYLAENLIKMSAPAHLFEASLVHQKAYSSSTIGT